MDAHASEGAGTSGRRRRARSRGRRGATDGGQALLVNTNDGRGEEVEQNSFSSSDDDRRTTGARPRKIIDRSASISQRESDLGRALVVSVFGNCLDSSAGSILATISQQFGIDGARIVIHRFGPARFLLTLPDAESATRVYGGGRPIISASHRLHVMRWSRFIDSSAATLPVAIELELRGIPAHAWEVETAQQLLNDSCWIIGLHPNTQYRRDEFRLTAWCSSLEHVPSKLELEIVEPPVAGERVLGEAFSCLPN